MVEQMCPHLPQATQTVRTLRSSAGRPVANRRILVITDYLPPQTHGTTQQFQSNIVRVSKHLEAALQIVWQTLQ